MFGSKKDLVVSPEQEHGLPLITAHDCRPADTLRPGLTRQFNPVGPVQQLLVEELARRAAQMREYDEALATLSDEAEAALANVLGSSSAASHAKLNVARAGAVAADQCEAVLRQGLSASRGFYRALAALRELQADRQTDARHELLPDCRFATEQACCAYLVRRFVDGAQLCRRCGQSGGGSFIAARQCWECRCCKAQIGLRAGTCMVRSALPLTKWFAAIRILLLRPKITPTELATTLRIDRIQTVRDLAKKIRLAIAADNASAQLAGLDDVYFFT